MIANPFFSGLVAQDWDGNGYSLKSPYVDGAETTYQDQGWVYARNESEGEAIPMLHPSNPLKKSAARYLPGEQYK